MSQVQIHNSAQWPLLMAGGRGSSHDENGGNGGSGGGSGMQVGTTYSGGTGIAGQGFAGSRGITNNISYGVSGAGGGAGGSPLDSHSGKMADGGPGKAWLNGVTYAGGGAALGDTGTIGYGGAGGGGNSGVNGTVNTGGGSGGASGMVRVGGSGVVVLRYYGTPQATGGTITSLNGYTYHTFTGSGSFVV